MSNDGELVLENYFLKPGYVYVPREPSCHFGSDGVCRVRLHI